MLKHTHTQTLSLAHICSSVSLLETVTCLAGSVTWADGAAQLGPAESLNQSSVCHMKNLGLSGLFLLKQRARPLCIPGRGWLIVFYSRCCKPFLLPCRFLESVLHHLLLLVPEIFVFLIVLLSVSPHAVQFL